MAGFVNALVRKILDFGGDPQGEAQLAVIDDQSTLLSRGIGAHALLWEKGDPMVTFSGTVPYDPQPVRVGPSGSIPIVDVNNGMLASTGADPSTDPVARVLAARMARS